MDRRIVSWAALGAILVSTVWSASVWARPKFMRKASATQPKAAATAEPSPIEWRRDLRTAHREALSTGRPLLVVFGASWCTYCKKLEAETLGHPSLANYINTAFVPVHLDFDRDRRAAQVLEVKSLPTCVILSADADLLGTVEGFVRPPEFTKTLHQAVDYQRELLSQRAPAEGP